MYNTSMRDDRLTTLTERGQTSVPASLRRGSRLRPGQKLRWEQVSGSEFRVVVVQDTEVPGALGMPGYARRFHPDDPRTTDQILEELREGEAG